MAFGRKNMGDAVKSSASMWDWSHPPTKKHCVCAHVFPRVRVDFSLCKCTYSRICVVMSSNLVHSCVNAGCLQAQCSNSAAALPLQTPSLSGRAGASACKRSAALCSLIRPFAVAPVSLDTQAKKCLRMYERLGFGFWGEAMQKLVIWNWSKSIITLLLGINWGRTWLFKYKNIKLQELFHWLIGRMLLYI